MSDSCKCRQVLTWAFEEAALALGGTVASYPIPDEAVWDLARALDLIHERACGRCTGGEALSLDEADDDEHPAIIHLLSQVRGRGTARQCPGSPPRSRAAKED